jgi:hypothetical protein
MILLLKSTEILT